MSEISVPEEYIQPKPEFDGGSFTISHFSPSPEGFEVSTRKSIGRTEGIASNTALSPEDRTRLKGAIYGKGRDDRFNELNFNGVQAVREARSAWRSAIKSGASEDEVTALGNTFYEEREKYQGKGKKLALRNIQVEGNTVTADTKFVSFPVYKELARPDDSPEVVDLSANAATAMIVRTADERFIIQHRAIAKQRLNKTGLTRGNALYMDIPGASAAGMLDASLKGKDRKPGTPDPVDTDSVKAAILKETGEELGLAPEDLESVRIVGLAQDRIKLHDEFLLLADSHLTSEQVRETSRTSKRNKNLEDADFEEKFVDIPANPQAVETLLTEVKSPLPPTHYAAMVAAGYSLVLQEQGLEAAEGWKKDMERKMQANVREMNTMITEYYNQHPEALTQVPERFWGKNVPPRNLHGYSPAYSPEEQGLPGFEDEMVRTGLIPETRRHVDTAYLFDVDGVLSDPKEKRVTEEGIYIQILEKLQSGEPVGLNTGRSTEWMEERVIRPLLERADDKSIFTNFVAIGEKGGTWITFDEEGNMQHGKSTAISVPEELNGRAKRLVEENYADSMFFDPTKETMISIEMHDGYDIAEFTKRQAQLKEELAQLLAETGQDKTYKIDPTTIATDIESPYVGKALGADRFLQFLKDKDLKPAQFKAFGDSKSDLAMADELERKHQAVDFVYVGDRAKLGDVQKDYPVEYVAGFSQGTLEYLSR